MRSAWLVLVALVFGCDDGASDGSVDARPADALPDMSPQDGPPDAAPDAAPIDPEEGQARLFSGRVVIPVEIELTETAIAQLTDDPRGAEVAAKVTVDGQVFPRVGLHLKGGRGSFRRIDQKAAFKINLDRYLKDANLYGLRKLTFNNMIQDKTLMRERLASLTFQHLGVPAPRVGYAEITVNGTLYGLYSHIESPDEVFLKRAFGETGGVLYEGFDDLDLWARHVDRFELDAGEDPDRQALRALISAVDQATPANFEEKVGAVVDLDALRRFFAAEIMTGHWDGYAQLTNNYYFYRRVSDGRFVFLPWGTDQAFQRTVSPYDGPGRLFRQCVDWLPCRLPYASEVLRQTQAFGDLDLASEIVALTALTEAPFSRERRTPTKPAQRLQAIEELKDYIAIHPRRISDGLTCLDPASDRDGDGVPSCAGDCNDQDPTIYRGAHDSCSDALDQDCSGFDDDGWRCPVCRLVEGPNDDADFLLCHRPERFGLARETCWSMGGEVASLRDEAEQAVVTEAAFARRQTRWWIGLVDYFTEGEWEWRDGAPLTFTAWRDGEPDDHGGYEDCGCFGAGGTAEWSDIYCGYNLPTVCRVPKGTVSP